jgi:hypothetical protein
VVVLGGTVVVGVAVVDVVVGVVVVVVVEGPGATVVDVDTRWIGRTGGG